MPVRGGEGWATEAGTVAGLVPGGEAGLRAEASPVCGVARGETCCCLLRPAAAAAVGCWPFFPLVRWCPPLARAVEVSLRETTPPDVTPTAGCAARTETLHTESEVERLMELLPLPPDSRGSRIFRRQEHGLMRTPWCCLHARPDGIGCALLGSS